MCGLGNSAGLRRVNWHGKPWSNKPGFNGALFSLNGNLTFNFSAYLNQIIPNKISCKFSLTNTRSTSNGAWILTKYRSSCLSSSSCWFNAGDLF